MKIKQYLLSEKEIDQMTIFERIKNKELTQEAAQILQLSVRQVRRKLKKYLAIGKITVTYQILGLGTGLV